MSPLSDDIHEDFEGETGRKGPLGPRELVFFGLFRSWIWIVLFTGLGLATGFVAAAAQPNTYASKGRLRLKAGVRESITPEVLMGLADSPRMSAAMVDEVYLLDDPQIYRDVARQLGPARLLRPADPREKDGPNTSAPVRLLHDLQARLFAARATKACQGEPTEQCVRVAGKLLKANTKIIPERGSNVLTVLHSATSPELAREVADALLAAFLVRHQEHYSTSSFAVRVEDELDTHYRSVEENRTAYLEHRGQCGFIDLNTQKGQVLTSIEERRHQVAEKKAERAKLQVQLSRAEERLATVPETIERVTPAVVVPNPEFLLWDKVHKELVVKKFMLVDQGKPYEIQKQEEDLIDRQLARVENRLIGIEEEIIESPEVVDTQPNSEHGDLREEIEILTIDDQALGAQIEDLESDLQAKRGRLELALECEAPHAVLQRAIDDSQRSYDELSSRVENVRALDKLELEGDSNLSIFQVASRPDGKEGPRR